MHFNHFSANKLKPFTVFLIEMDVYTKAQLQGLKDLYVKHLFNEQCNKAIEEIYNTVIETAKLGKMEYTTSIIQYQLKDSSLVIVMDKLKSLFPDANVMYIDRKTTIALSENMDLNKMGIISINWM